MALPKQVVNIPGVGVRYTAPIVTAPKAAVPKPTPFVYPYGRATALTQPAPAPAAPTPAAAPGPAAPAPVSWQDSTYNQTVGAVNQSLNNLQTYLTNQGQALGLNYGVNYTGDPTTGTAGNFQIDPNVDVSNPFSKAALLKKSYDQSVSGNTNSYAAQGQLYSGALQNAQNQSGLSYQQGQDALLKDFGSQFGGLYQQWLQAQQAATGQLTDAQAAALARAEASGNAFGQVASVAGPALAAGAPITPQGTLAPPPPPGTVLKPGTMYLPNDGKTQAQIVNPDGTVRPATAADKGGTATPAPPPPPPTPPPPARDKGGTTK